MPLLLFYVVRSRNGRSPRGDQSFFAPVKFSIRESQFDTGKSRNGIEHHFSPLHFFSDWGFILQKWLCLSCGNMIFDKKSFINCPFNVQKLFSFWFLIENGIVLCTEIQFALIYKSEEKEKAHFDLKFFDFYSWRNHNSASGKWSEKQTTHHLLWNASSLLPWDEKKRWSC